MASFQTNIVQSGYLILTWSETSQSIEQNYTDISWQLTGANKNGGDYYTTAQRFRVTINGESSYRNERINVRQGDSILTGTKRIYHKDNGSANVSFSIGAEFYYYGKENVTASNSYDLTVIPRKSTFTSSLPQNINTSNARIQANCNIKTSQFDTVWELSYLDDEGRYQSLGLNVKNQTNIDYTIPQSFIEQFVSHTPNAQRRPIVLTLATRKKNTSVNIGVEFHSFILNIDNNYASTITSIQLNEIEQRVRDLALGDNTFLQEKSTIQYNASLNLKNNATARNIKVEFQDIVLNGGVVGTLKPLKSGNNQILKLTLTDSRGFTSSKDLQLNVLPYTQPQVTSFRINRNADIGSRVIANLEIAISDIISKNHYNLQIEVKKEGTSNWVNAFSMYSQKNLQKILNPIALIGTFELDSTYQVRCIISDLFDSSTVFNEIGSSRVVMHFGKLSVAIGDLLSNEEFDKFEGLKVFGKIIDEKGKLYLKQGMRQTFEIVSNFSSGVNHYGGAYGKAMYCKDAFDRIFIQGHIKINGAPTGIQKLFTLPEGYRPKTVKFFTVIDDALNQGTVEVLPSGLVQSRTVKNTNFICLDGITFVEGE